MAVNSCRKFGLLMWKNWLLEKRHKWQLFFEIAFPLLFCGLLLSIRALIDVKKYEEPTIFPSISLNNSYAYLSELAFSPNNSVAREIVSKAYNIMGLKNNLTGFDNEAALEDYLADKEFGIGIVFTSLTNTNVYPNKLKYALRFPSDSSSISAYTDVLFPEIELSKPRSIWDDSSFYNQEGFLRIQNAIAMSFSKLALGKDLLSDNREIVIQRYPYPPYTDDTFIEVMGDVIPAFILLCFISPFGVLVKQITGEKEHQLKEVMKMMGLDNWLHWLAWFTKSMIFLVVISIVMVILFKIPLGKGEGLATFGNSHWSTLLVFLIVYSIATTTFAIMVAVFFSRANTASAVTSVIFFITFIPFYMIKGSFMTSGVGRKVGLCFLFNTAMSLGTKLIMKLEGAGFGLQWDNMWKPPSIDDDLPIGFILLMMLLDSVLYMLIGLYIERIFPGEYGVPEPWYFPFMKTFWCGVPVDDTKDDVDIASIKNVRNFEPGPLDKHAGIKIRGLRKLYGKNKVAVSGLTMDMYEDQITALLGHNGAGKTTTMSMLTGLFPPTSGTAIINGSDIRLNIKGVRSSLGMCPQRNVIFPDLTVSEHLTFYCTLKGLNKTQTEEEIKKYLGRLELLDKINSLSSALSGGMKRKLCVAIALCGYSKIVLLDEPTSGMDPAARRSLWNLLQQDKKGRTVLLSTHFMDEADVLGDRIAILSHGDLKACGTSFFLKKQFGIGYHLICEKGTRCNSYNITKLLQKHIPSIAVESNVGSELSYRLPDESVSVFERMLKELEDNSENLHLTGYGISPTTLEEVFMRVESEMDADRRNDTFKQDSEYHDSEALTLHDYNMDPSTLMKGIKLHGAQWVAMFTKKFYYLIRNWIMLLIHIIIPVGILVATILSSPSEKGLHTPPALTFSLNDYGSTVTILETPSDTTLASFTEQYEKMFDTFAPKSKLVKIKDDFEEYILKLGETTQITINRAYMIAASANEDNVTAWFNYQAYHTAPLSLNMIHNAFVRVLDHTYSIEVTNKPLPYTKEYLKRHLEDQSMNGFNISFSLGFAMCFVSTFFALFSIKERVCKSKLLQFVSGANILTFWLSSFVWDFLFFIGIVTIVTITFAILGADGYSTATELGRIYLVLVLFAYSAIPATYILSLLFRDSATGYGKIAVIYVFLGPAAFMVVWAVDLAVFRDSNDTLAWYFRIIPQYSMCNAISNMYMMSLQMSTLCPNGNTAKAANSVCEMDYFSMKKPGIGGDLIFLAIDGIFYMAILLIIEYRIFNELVFKIIRLFRRRTPMLSNISVDDDVLAEKNKIKSMSGAEIQSYNLVLNEVTKYYKNFRAVNQISVAVQRSECFGLLGVNGAGKTSTFKMLTGDEKISSGDIYVQGIDLKKQMSVVYRHIGYCPQFDALIEDLSGREIIRIFCLLRGVPFAKINPIAKELAKNLGFYEHLDKRINEYSGGTKRKISTALALVGGPDIIYLDEPTTGMDPKSRRQLWDVICKIRDSGRTIILTSHSMEECEALCTRLAIMVNGEFMCIGSRQHLKNKFSKGLILIIKMKKFDENRNAENANENGYEYIFGDVVSSKPTSKFIVRRSQSDIPEDLALKHLNAAIMKVKEFVNSHFPGAVLKDEYKELLTFYVPETSIKWSRIFGLMQANRYILNIEDYSISQTTLEQIFLDFAQNQY